MNDEELKQLKPGDEIFIRARFKEVLEDGDVLFSHTVKNAFGRAVRGETFTNPENIVLPSALQPAPKYDPCRLFKKGDKVKYSLRDGRDFFDMPWVYDAASVIEEEDRAGMVVVRFTFNYGEPSVHKVPWYHLQLVTPVEELEPYYVKDDGTHYVVGKRPEEPEIVYLAEYSKARHPHAKESAEAERDRLNEEYRKGKE